MRDEDGDGVPDKVLDDAATGEGWWGRWRQVQAWELTFETPILVGLITWQVIQGNKFVVDALSTLLPIINIYLMARYAVLGVHVYRGSMERQFALKERTSSRED